jgi:arginyl-tRNA synthetase
MVIDPETGKKVEKKGSTRKGIYDTLDDMVKWTSADAIRYHLLAYSPTTHITFDVEEVVKQSNDNPVYYIQNAHVRCCGIFREAEERGFDDEGADMSLLGENELKFIRKALELGDIIEASVMVYEPHKIAFFAHEVASTFHPIYDKVRVLHSEVPEDVAKARLRFYKAAQVVLHRLLRLMGMSAPERM